jgi:hypothetical protein
MTPQSSESGDQGAIGRGATAGRGPWPGVGGRQWHRAVAAVGAGSDQLGHIEVGE